MFIVWLTFIVCLALVLYTIFLMVGDIAGAPFVPLVQKDLNVIFKHLKVKKSDVFVDLGSGDGRVVRIATQTLGIPSIGVEINPFLVVYSRILSRLKKDSQAHFILQNFQNFPLTSATMVFMYLYPEAVIKLGTKIQKECLKGTQIISVAFAIPEWEKNLYKAFSTPSGKMVYWYKLPSQSHDFSHKGG